MSLLGALFCASAAIAQIDTKATPETAALFRNLKRLSEQHILFGHQHATEYGHGWSGEAERSKAHLTVRAGAPTRDRRVASGSLTGFIPRF